MALFQEAVVRKHLLNLDEQVLEIAYNEYKRVYSPAKIKNIRVAKEEQYQEGFIKEIFGFVLGYSVYPDSPFNIQTEKKNETNSRKADGAILKDEKVVGVIELKDNKTKNLDAVKDQAFGYKNNHKDCSYVISSNFHKLRFYIDDATEYEEFDLYNLDKESFKRFYLYLRKEGLLDKNLPKLLRQETKFHEEEISKKLYKDYSNFKRSFFENAVKNNPQFDKLELFKKSQKFLDRILFLLFAEDKGLVGTNSIVNIVERWSGADDDYYQPLYEMVNKYFGHLYNGYTYQKTGEVIPQFGGELFSPDQLLESLKIDDDILKNDLLILSKYDFNTDVDVNILGHIFEHSLNEVDDVEAELRGEVLDKTKSKRKKDGVFYTPKYITKYIVDNTLGKLCAEKKTELKLDEDFAIYEYQKSDGKLNEKGKNLFERLNNYKSWLLTLKVCDPACGSGAFLNQALSYFIEEHKFVDDLIAELTNSPLRLFDTDLQILENNIYGVDINEESVEIAKLSMWLRTAQTGRKLSDLSNNIKCGDSLIDDPDVAGEKAFSWEREFPTVFEKGGFDVVIGNPPYVRQELFKEIKPYLEKHYKCYNSIADLYTYFIEKGIDLMNSKGLFSFILPNKFIKATYGKEIRNVMLKKTSLSLLVDFDDFPVFPDATTYPIIFVLEQKSIENFYYSSLNKRTVTNDSIGYLDANKYLVNKSVLTSDSWSFNKSGIQDLLTKIVSLSKPLKEIVDNKIFAGIASGKNDVFIVNDLTEFHEDENAKKQLKLILGGSEIDRYNITPENNYILFIPWDYEIENSESIKNYLIRNKESLEVRPEVKEGRFNWFCLSRYGSNNSHLLDKPKIIAPFINNRCNFYLDESGDIYLQKNSMFISSDSKSLLAFLNSKVSFFYLKSVSTTLQGGYYDFRRDKIQFLPVPNNLEQNSDVFNEIVIKISDLKNQENLFCRKFTNYFSLQYSLGKIPGKLMKWYDLTFVDFAKELNKAIKAVKGTSLSKKDEFEWMELFEENKKKVLEIKSQIDQTDKEIDRMVYDLYGLTEKEIQIVENS